LDPSKYTVEVVVAFFKKKPSDDYPRIETRVGVHFTIKITKKWFYVCISWCKINLVSENAQKYKIYVTL
jgi:hypothetical protein